MDFRQFVKKRIKNVFDGFVLYNGRTRRLKRNNIQNIELPITGNSYPENREDDFTTGNKRGEIYMVHEKNKIEIGKRERRTKTNVEPTKTSYILEANKNSRNLPSIEEVSEELSMG